MNKTALNITGMHCASCSTLVTMGLKKVEGVKDASVNLSAEKAYITYDENKVDVGRLISAVKSAGYGASIVDEKNSAASEEKKTEEINGWRNRFFISAFLSLPMLYFMLMDFFPEIFGKMLMPYMGIISLGLTIPVSLLLGRDFIRVCGAV